MPKEERRRMKTIKRVINLGIFGGVNLGADILKRGRGGKFRAGGIV
jgi:hypothetical protein